MNIIYNFFFLIHTYHVFLVCFLHFFLCKIKKKQKSFDRAIFFFFFLLYSSFFLVHVNLNFPACSIIVSHGRLFIDVIISFIFYSNIWRNQGEDSI